MGLSFSLERTRTANGPFPATSKLEENGAPGFKAVFHEPMKLNAQFRCNGSTGYLNWLDDVLQVRETGNFEGWGDGQYEFEVFEKAEDLYAALQEKNGDNKARLIAGYSWPWPSKGRERGTKIKHVQADGLELPWNFAGENWASAVDGIGQVGCIHTVQGLEFDWQGVLIGDDLAFIDGRVQGVPAKRAKTDKSLSGFKKELKEAKGNQLRITEIEAKADQIIKSTYRVLLSRGRKGTLVWCQDKALAAYLKQRLASARPRADNTVVFIPKIHPKPVPGSVPFYSLQAAAGAFGREHAVEALGWIEVPGKKLNKNMFVARIKGRSMAPTLMDGDYCVFEAGVQGSRNGKIVLAEHRGVADPETGGSYSVKFYYSEKEVGEDYWAHTKILLKPMNPEFEAIEIPEDRAGEFRVVAEYREKLGVRA